VLAGLEMVHTARFPATPECAAFVPRGDGDGDGAGWELVVGLRDTAHLVYVDCSAAASSSSSSASGLPSFAQRTVSLNEADWDTHVSFTPLALAPSPDRRHLLVATDQVGRNYQCYVSSSHACAPWHPRRSTSWWRWGSPGASACWRAATPAGPTASRAWRGTPGAPPV